MVAGKRGITGATPKRPGERVRSLRSNSNDVFEPLSAAGIL
ncbi:MAG TPA: hypothetical protein VMU76_00940 [Acidimicrobiales bacterium]|nr:hypothetical protein [Acidimicrobiales bacterium]